MGQAFSLPERFRQDQAAERLEAFRLLLFAEGCALCVAFPGIRLLGRFGDCWMSQHLNTSAFSRAFAETECMLSMALYWRFTEGYSFRSAQMTRLLDCIVSVCSDATAAAC